MNKFNRGIKTNKLLIVFLMMVCVFIVTSCDTSTKELSGGKAKDDMTVVVSKIFGIN